MLVDSIKAHEHSLIGIHGMLIFNHQDQWYASHLPLANSIHSHQIVFSFEIETKDNSEDKKIKSLATQQALMTIVPEVFDLRRLMKKTLMNFKATIYQGHFERGGTIAAESVSIKVRKLYLNKALSAKSNGHYYTIPTSSGSGLLLHRIGQSPSFDQILEFRKRASRKSKIALPELIDLRNVKPLRQLEVDHPLIKITNQFYLETKDFE